MFNFNAGNINSDPVVNGVDYGSFISYGQAVACWVVVISAVVRINLCWRRVFVVYKGVPSMLEPFCEFWQSSSPLTIRVWSYYFFFFFLNRLVIFSLPLPMASPTASLAFPAAFPAFLARLPAFTLSPPVASLAVSLIL